MRTGDATPGPGLDSLSTPVWIFDVDHHAIVWANAAALAFWGADDLAALRARPFGADMTPAVRARLDAVARRLRRGERLRETWTLFPRHAAVTVSCALGPIALDDGRTAMLVEAHPLDDDAALEDRRTIEALRHAPILFVLTDRDGRLISANPLAAACLPELSPPAASVPDILIADTLERAALQGALAGGRHHAAEIAVTTVEGPRWMALDGRPLPDPVTGQAAYLIAMTDITERRRLEDELRASEETLRRVVETAPVPLVVTRPADGCLLYTNAATADLFGIPCDLLVGRTIVDFYLSRDDRQTLLDALDEIGTTVNVEVGLRTARGRPFAAAICARLISHRGEPAILAAISDIEADTKARRVLVEALDRQTRLNEAQKQFVTMLSHEFKTPLSVIEGSARRLGKKLAGTPSQPEAAPWLLRIRDASRRISDLISEVLMMARTDDRLMTVNAKPIDLSALLHGVVDRYRRIAPVHTFELAFQGLQAPVAVDPQFVDIILSNLLGNAIKYSPDGGRIIVAATAEGERITVAVTDHGLGIPAEEIAHVFERFYRCSTHSGIPGTGIGLHIAKGLVDLHGGSMSVDSRYGQGSTFRFDLLATTGTHRSDCLLP